jgi:hypothetical protein
LNLLPQWNLPSGLLSLFMIIVFRIRPGWLMNDFVRHLGKSWKQFGKLEISETLHLWEHRANNPRPLFAVCHTEYHGQLRSMLCAQLLCLGK